MAEKERVSDEREFQLQMAEAQIRIGNLNAILTLMIAVAFSLFGVFTAISYSITNSVLSGPTIFNGSFTDGINNYTGQVTGITSANSAFFSYLNVLAAIFGIVGMISLALLLFIHFYISPLRFKKIRQNFITNIIQQPIPIQTTNEKDNSKNATPSEK
jgi:uncharacterized membrane protein